MAAQAKFQRCYLAKAAYVALSSTEFARQESLNEVPSYRWPHSPAAHADDIHVVILNSLAGREMIVNESCTDADNLVGADRRAYATTADCDTAKYVTRGYGTREWNNYVGIVVRGVQLMSTEINHIMASRPQLIEQLLL